MKLLAAIREPHQTETRAKSREATAPDQTDQSGHGFDGVLSKVKSRETQTPLKRSISSGADTSAPTDPAQKATTNATMIAGSGIAGLASGTSVQSSRHADPLSPGSNEGSVDNLLKRFKSKHDDETSDVNAAPGLPSTDPTVLPVLVANLSAGTSTDGRSDPNIVSVLQTKGQTAGPPGEAESNPNGRAPSQDSGYVVGVSVSAHIAPAKVDDMRDRRSDEDHSRPVQRADGHPTITPNGDCSSRQDDKPPSRGKSEVSPHAKVEGPVTATPEPITLQAPIRDIATAVAELATQASSIASSVPETSKPASAAPAHTVILQMSPADLGTVEIRLHLSGQVLDLHLKISEKRTAGLIARERETLTRALEDRSYQLNSIVIQDASVSPASEGSHVAKHETSSGTQAERQSGGNAGHGPEGRGDGQRGQSREQPTRGAPRSNGDSASRARASDGRSLFI